MLTSVADLNNSVSISNQVLLDMLTASKFILESNNVTSIDRDVDNDVKTDVVDDSDEEEEDADPMVLLVDSTLELLSMRADQSIKGNPSITLTKKQELIIYYRYKRLL